MNREFAEPTQDDQVKPVEPGEPEGGKLTDEVLEEKLHEGKGPLPFVPGADGDKAEPPLPDPTHDTL